MLPAHGIPTSLQHLKIRLLTPTLCYNCAQARPNAIAYEISLYISFPMQLTLELRINFLCILLLLCMMNGFLDRPGEEMRVLRLAGVYIRRITDWSELLILHPQ
jgi:hypothetical protein